MPEANTQPAASLPRPASSRASVGSRASGLTLAELWTVLAIGLPVLGSMIAPMSTVDLAYQVRAGQLMLESGSILTTDPFTFTVGGEPWLNQQWAAGVLFGLGYEAVGWAGLAVVRGLLIGLTFALAVVACRASGASPRTSALLAIAAFAVSVPSLGLRAQLLGMVLMAATLALLALRKRRPRLLWLLPILFVAWANVHGSFIIGLLAIGAALVADRVARRPGSRLLAVVLVLCTVATLLNPFGAGVWIYSVGLTTSSQITRLISEWQPTSVRSYTGLAFAASAIAMAALLVWRGRLVGWPVLAWLALLFVVGLYAERGVAWWALGAAPIAALLLAGATERLGAGGTVPAAGGISSAPHDRRRLLNLAVAAGLAVAILAALPTWRGGEELYGPDGLLLDAPPGVTDSLREVASSDDRLFAAQRWASWFEFAVPDVPVMVDSRIELFSDDVWTDYLAVTGGREDWREILGRWGVTIIAITQDGEENLRAFIADDPGWMLVHSDEGGAVYVRSDPGG